MRISGGQCETPQTLQVCMFNYRFQERFAMTMTSELRWHKHVYEIRKGCVICYHTRKSNLLIVNEPAKT